MAIYVLPLGLPSWIQTFCFLIIFFVFFFTVLVVSPVQQIFQATATSYKRANEEPMGNVGRVSCRSRVLAPTGAWLRSWVQHFPWSSPPPASSHLSPHSLPVIEEPGNRYRASDMPTYLQSMGNLLAQWQAFVNHQAVNWWLRTSGTTPYWIESVSNWPIFIESDRNSAETWIVRSLPTNVFRSSLYKFLQYVSK